MSDFANIKIKTDGKLATVILNGVDVSSQVSAYKIITHKAGQPPLVTLTFVADELEFEGDEDTFVLDDPEECLILKMGENGRLQISNPTELQLIVGEPVTFVRKK